MPVSKKRGGKKAHNKRIAKRKANIAASQRIYEKLYTNMMQSHLEKLNQEQHEPSRSEETPEN